ncbi:MAG TPA: alkaline phosphatase family protein [Microvirga sp.]|jgi:predicted AlkP superfamily pyrophosphatase or phosphodiesterase|nr:alkaline phosphatase family protein [Microvirga sp.]
MGHPTVFVILDGLRYDAARSSLGYMEALVAAGQAQVYRVVSELPSLSRPLYATLMTGRRPVDHGIVGNAIVRRLEIPSVFSLARAAGLTTAAAAYHWFSELYNEAPFEPHHRLTDRPDRTIQHGSFYWSDDYPGDHTFADAHSLIERARPDFVVVHPMNVDDAGHKHGGDSVGYRNAVRASSAQLSFFVPLWRAKGYTVIVTSDHGMNADGNHGGPGEAETHVPFYTVDPARFTLDPAVDVRQLDIAGTLCASLGIAEHGLAATKGLLKP